MGQWIEDWAFLSFQISQLLSMEQHVTTHDLQYWILRPFDEDQHNSFVDLVRFLYVVGSLESFTLSCVPIPLPTTLLHPPHPSILENDTFFHTTLRMEPCQYLLYNCCSRRIPPMVRTCPQLPLKSRTQILNRSSRVWIVLSNCPSVWGWYAELNRKSVPIAFCKLTQNHEVNLGSRSETMDTGIPCSLTISFMYIRARRSSV